MIAYLLSGRVRLLGLGGRAVRDGLCEDGVMCVARIDIDRGGTRGNEKTGGMNTLRHAAFRTCKHKF